MKSRLLLVLVLAITLFSCQEVIDVDLNSVDPQLVVEGAVSLNDTVARVKLSLTVNFDETNTFPPAEGADVTITDDLGTVVTLFESHSYDNGSGGTVTRVTPGYYTAPLKSEIGRHYTLRIGYKGKVFTSTSVLNPPVAIDTLYVADTGGFNPPDVPSTYMVCGFYDPEGIANAYRFIQSINGKEDPYIYAGEDKFQDGAYVKASLFGSKLGFEIGDTVVVQMQMIDKPTCDYLVSLSQLVQDGGGSASPTNPKSNIEGGAMGCFYAYSETRDTLIIK